MKIRVEIDEKTTENEVVIRCSSLSDEVLELQHMIAEKTSKSQEILFLQGEREYYFPLKKVLFFETDADGVCAHTAEDVYKVKYKLYELEELLTGSFMRVSKSTILNLDEIYSIEKKISASSIVQFQNSHKQVYVSRHYLRALKDRLEEKRIRG